MSTKEVKIFRPWATTKTHKCKQNDNLKSISKFKNDIKTGTGFDDSTKRRRFEEEDYNCAVSLSNQSYNTDYQIVNNNCGYIPLIDPYWNTMANDFHQMTCTQQSTRTKQRPKKFRCPHCQVGFSNNGQLKGHVRIHTGEENVFLFIIT